MAPGSLSAGFSDRANPLEGTISLLYEVEADQNYSQDQFGPFAAQIFSSAGKEYCEKYGATMEHFASISAKNHKHAVKNPYAQFRTAPSVKEVMNSRKITRELTLPMCSPTSDGGAAAVLCSEAFVKKHKLEDRAVEVAGVGLSTDTQRLYEDKSRIELAGADMTRRAAKMAFKMAGIQPQDIQVLELHDCFAWVFRSFFPRRYILKGEMQSQ